MNTILGPLALTALPDQAATALTRPPVSRAPRPVATIFSFALALAGGATSASGGSLALLPEGTSAAPRMYAPVLDGRTHRSESPGRRIAEIKRLSGLTWEELAAVLGVSRRTLHLWVNGRPISAPNEVRLTRLFAAVRSIYRDTSAATRSAIMTPAGPENRIPLDLLTSGSFDDFIALVGLGRGQNLRPSLPLSASARAARTPVPPVDLLGAQQNSLAARPRSFVSGKTVKRPPRTV